MSNNFKQNNEAHDKLAEAYGKVCGLVREEGESLKDFCERVLKAKPDVDVIYI